MTFTGFGFGNKPVVFSGDTVGYVQNVEERLLQMYCPSRPVTSAKARTCVQMAPKVVASKSSSQVAAEWKPELVQS